MLLVMRAESKAQFSKAVVVLKGTVRLEHNLQPVSAKVSVRAANDTALEITASRSNSETGNYLVVLNPGKKYWIHVEAEKAVAKDLLFEAPLAEASIQVLQDFLVQPLTLELSENNVEIEAKEQESTPASEETTSALKQTQEWDR